MVTCLFCPILHALSRAWDTRETQEVHQEGEGLAGHMHTRKGRGLEVRRGRGLEITWYEW